MSPPTLTRPIPMPSPGASRRRFLAALAGGLLSGPGPVAARANGLAPRVALRPTTATAPERLKQPHGGRFAVKLKQASL